MEYKHCCVGSLPMLRPVSKTALLAAVVVAAASPSADGQTIIPISQMRTTNAHVLVSQCNQEFGDNDAAAGFGPFNSVVNASVACPDAMSAATVTQQSQIDAASITASGSSSNDVTAVAGGVILIFADSAFSVTFELPVAANFSLNGLIDAGVSGAFTNGFSSAGVSLTRQGGPEILNLSVDADLVNPGPGPQVFAQSGVLEAGMYTLSASTHVFLDDASVSSFLADASFNFTFQISNLDVCTPVARFQGLGQPPAGNVLTTPVNVSANGMVVVGATNNPAGPEAFRWTAADGIVNLGTLPGAAFASGASATSADGSVVTGDSLNSGGNLEAFRWTPSGGMVGLGDLPGGLFRSNGQFVSDDGSVIAGVGFNSFNAKEVFRWTAAGGLVGLGGLPGSNAAHTTPVAMSADGTVIVGNGSSTAGLEGFRWTEAGGMVGLGDLPGGTFKSRAEAGTSDGNIVVGSSISANGTEAFRWTPGGGMVGLGVIPGGEATFSSQALGISSDGSVIVGSSSSANGIEAFRWTAQDGMIDLGDLPGGRVESFATAALADGSVVGQGCVAIADISCIFDPFLWDAVNGMQPLQDGLVRKFGSQVAGWSQLRFIAVSRDSTTLVGSGINPSGSQEGWIATIGSPAGVCCLAAAPVRPPTVVAANRYLSLSAGLAGTSVALRVTFVSLPPPFDQFDGLSMWVGPPESVSELPGVVTPPAAGPAFTAATLQCTPLFADWSTHGTIRIFHEDIVPGGIYNIQVIDQRCNPVNEAAFSAPLTMATATWGDLVGPFDPQAGVWTAPDGSVDVTFDAVAQINKFMGLGTAPIKARADLEPALPDQLINITDIVVTLDAFKGQPFPFAPGPIPCGG